ncbi:ATP-binding cassette domain-containing protein [Microtetraspora niveoalba]|uniref:ATP-binding cassette domain-containing protein n=1 Tax=Microtetraspora niveoalba TaxID=46175 RepID=UPI00082BA704|nr:ATP-binding cassette domain-containing protein [Microtetraspora niveoalba]
MGDFAIVAKGLRKLYGGKPALDGLNLRVPQGTVRGLLGPNGAGKTTTVRILATLLRFDGGRAEVAGHDVATQAALVRRRIGLVGQNAAVDEVLSGRQNLVLFGRLFHLDGGRARRRADELLEQFGLDDTGSQPVRTYSGGMRRRLDLAASMILTPSVLFLDEPTVGLDPRGRNEVWEAVRSLVRAGTTVLLTTQYLEEADRLSDRISIADTGKVIAEGTPDELKSTIGGDRIDVVVRDPRDLPRAAAAVARVSGGEPTLDDDRRMLSVQVRGRVGTLAETIRTLDAAGLGVEDIALRRPTLDEVFLHLTGRRTQSADGAGGEEKAGKGGTGRKGAAGTGDGARTEQEVEA